MSATVIVLLIGLWVVVLMPGLLRARRDVSPATSISRFNDSMDLLARTRRDANDWLANGPPTPDAPPVATPRARARQDWWADAVGWARAAPWAGWATSGRARPRRGRPHRGRVAPTGRGATRGGAARQSQRGVMAARRRAVLATLAGVTLLGAALLPLLPRVGWSLTVIGSVACVTYLGLLWRLRQRRELRSRVRHLDGGAAPVSVTTGGAVPYPVGGEPAPRARAVGLHPDA